MPDFVRYPDPRLSLKAQARPVDDELRAIGGQLLAAQQEAQSYGLAAAHIGYSAPVIVLNLGSVERREDRLYFNPVALEVAEVTALGAEASVSLPGVAAQIARPVWVDMAFDDADGARQTVRLEGFQARCALHEMEQMGGRFYLSNLSRLKREMLLKKASKLRS